jgi:hypothetical protein
MPEKPLAFSQNSNWMRTAFRVFSVIRGLCFIAAEYRAKFNHEAPEKH